MTHTNSTPANPAQGVSEEQIDAAIEAWNDTYEAEIQIGALNYTDNKREAMRAALTAAIGAGGQAVAWGFYYDDGSGGKHMVCLQKPTHWNGYPIKNVTPLYTHPAPSGQAVAEVNSPAWLAAQETLTGTCAWCRGTGSVRTRDLHDEISTERCPRCGGQGVILSALSQPHPADERVVGALREAGCTTEDGTYVHAPMKEVVAALSGSSAGAGGSVQPGWRGIPVTDETVTYITQYGGRCRDCADAMGVCPTSGLPCDPHEARAAIRHVLSAVNYGFGEGFLSLPAAPQPKGE